MSSGFLVTTIDVSVLILLVLLLRLPVRRLLGAQAAYLLWILIPLRMLMPQLPERPRALEALLSIAQDPLPDPTAIIGPLPPSLSWLTIWGVGLLTWLGLRATAHARFKRRLDKHSTEIKRDELDDTLVRGLRNFPGEVMRTPSPAAPFAMGCIHPRIYVPSDFEATFSLRQQHWIIKHELAHIARGDLWVQWLAELIRAVFWFNPLAHLALPALRRDQEYACDQGLLGQSSSKERIEYGETLLQGASRNSASHNMTFFTSHKERYKMIAKHKLSPSRTALSYVLMASLAVLSLTTSPAVTAGALDDKPLTLNFQQIQATTLLNMISNYIGIEIHGQERLQQLRLDVNVQAVSARRALEVILRCRGYDFTERPDHSVEIIPTEAGAGDGHCP